MKKIINIILSFFSICCISCSEDKIDTYSVEDNIYFTWSKDSPLLINNLEKYIDSLQVTFAYATESVTDTIFMLPVSVQGFISNKDREINIKITEQSTAIPGTHFSLPEKIIFRAGLHIDSIPLTIYRKPDMKTQPLLLGIELLPSSDFSVAMKDEIIDQLTGEKRNFTVFNLFLDDIIRAPKYWNSDYLGTFTSKKIFLMSELLGVSAGFYNNVISTDREIEYHGIFMQRYLNEKRATGDIIYEDDGSEMVMGTLVQ